MTPRDVKDALYEQFARVGKVTGHPKRIELLDLLCQGERSVEEIAAATDMSMTSASAQLQVLRAARLVSTQRDGRRVLYRVADDSVCRLVQAVQDAGRARLSEVGEILREHFEAGDELDPVTIAELSTRMRKRGVVVLDVRPVAEYDAGHVPGAVSVPIEELAGRMSELPRNAEVVAYCRGPYCVLAPQAVEALRARGRRRVRRLDVGFPEWRLAGLPVEVGREAS